MKRLVLALVVVGALAMSLATVSTASADITLTLPNDDMIDVPDAARAAGASPVIQAPPPTAP